MRIIPTRVGTRFVPGFIDAIAKDHPHACGDKSTILIIGGNSLGSSPRVWGQGGDRAYQAFKLVDHPHACGDKSTGLMYKGLDAGSSPRVWGQD